MQFELKQLGGAQLESAAQHYAEHGFFLITRLDEAVTARFRPVLAGIIGAETSELAGLLAAEHEPLALPPDVRRRLARIETSEALTQSLLDALGPLLVRLIGPVVHVSSTFHAQFKGNPVRPVDHGGYGADYLEVQGRYLLHQDFTGANIPTSPSALTLWVAQNTTPHWNLRLYPGSHRQGMLTNRWLELDDPRAAPMGRPIDIEAREGTAVVFNSMLLHGTSNPGPMQRVSCDIRFFPLCGFLPSTPRVLSRTVLRSRDRDVAEHAVLRAPILEGRVWLGQDVELEEPRPHSVLNWVRYIAHVRNGEPEKALHYLERFTNLRIGVDGPGVYAAKFLGCPVYESTIETARREFAPPAQEKGSAICPSSR